MPESATAKSAQAPVGSLLSARIGLARAAVFWERCWPEFAAALGVLGVFVAAALFDLPEMVPGWVHAGALALLAALLVVAIWQGVRALRFPGESEGRRRIEAASGLEHRPLATLADRLAGGGGDPVSVALWQAHRERMARRVRSLRVGVPLAGFLGRDPYGLRVVLTIALLIGFLSAGPDSGDRVLRAVAPQRSFTPGVGAPVTLDIWVTPPDYTGDPPLFLQRDAAKDPILVPTGSTVLAQVSGGSEQPKLEIAGKSTEFARIDAKNFKGGATLTAGDRRSVTQAGRTLGSWPIKIVPDLPPTITFANIPQKQAHDQLKIEFRAADDYGVEGAKAVMKRVDGPDDDLMTLDLPLPGLHLKAARNAAFYDLTPHPWAGLPVEMHLEASDALGQIGKSETVTLTLPERIFHHPFAKALIEQRRELTIHPKDRDVVSETLSDLSQRPAFFDDDKVVFLGLRIAAMRLPRGDAKTAIPSVQQLLWDLALRLEDGHATMAQRDLRDLMQALQDAINRNAAEWRGRAADRSEPADVRARPSAHAGSRQGPRAHGRQGRRAGSALATAEHAGEPAHGTAAPDAGQRQPGDARSAATAAAPAVAPRPHLPAIAPGTARAAGTARPGTAPGSGTGRRRRAGCDPPHARRGHAPTRRAGRRAPSARPRGSLHAGLLRGAGARLARRRRRSRGGGARRAPAGYQGDYRPDDRRLRWPWQFRRSAGRHAAQCGPRSAGPAYRRQRGGHLHRRSPAYGAEQGRQLRPRARQGDPGRAPPPRRRHVAAPRGARLHRPPAAAVLRGASRPRAPRRPPRRSPRA